MRTTNDPVGRMFKGGQLRRETDQDGKAAEARLKANWRSGGRWGLTGGASTCRLPRLGIGRYLPTQFG
jgi:hypothetical protein